MTNRAASDALKISTKFTAPVFFAEAITTSTCPERRMEGATK